jgi:WD40 repeat protein
VFKREQLSGPPRIFLNPDAPTPADAPWANWDLVTLRHPAVHWVDLSRDGRRVATGTDNSEGKGVAIWDADSGERLHELPVPGPAFVRFSPDGEHLVTAERDAYRLWRVRDGALEQTLAAAGLEGRPGRAAFSADGRLLAVAPSRRLVKLLDASTWEELATLTPPSPQEVSWLCFRPDGGQLAVATAHRQIHLWDIHGIRRRLAAMHLDWGPDTPPEDKGEPATPLRVEVLPEEVKQPPPPTTK